MTISSDNRKAGPYSGDGISTQFPFEFKVFSAADLLVILTNSAGAETTLSGDGADYLVTLNLDQNASPGGVITKTSVLPDEYLLTITSDIENLQKTDLTNQGGFYPAVITTALDRLTILIQQLAEKVSRSVKINISSTSSPDQILEDMNTLVFAAGQEANAAAGYATAAQSQANNAAAAAQAAADSAAEAAASVPAMADQAEAEAGTENSKFMSALRVAQAFIARFGPGSVTLDKLDRTGPAWHLLVSNGINIAPAWVSELFLGVNQTLQNVTATRALNTTYTNSSGKPIFVNVHLTQSVGGSANLQINGGASYQSSNQAGVGISIAGIVPAGATYRLVTGAGVGTLVYWSELRA